MIKKILFGVFLLIGLSESKLNQPSKMPTLIDVEPQIVGGKVAPHDYPFMGSLQRKIRNSKSYKHYCGTTLIHPEWAVTASHCVSESQIKDLRIVFEKYNLNGKDEKYTTIRGVQKIIVNDNGDIALLKIPKISELRPIILTNMLVKANTMVRTMGWGYTKEGSGKTSDKLMYVDVPMVDEKMCKKSYPEVTNKYVCAGYKKGKKDSCSGDSGGPLFYMTNNDIPVQNGIVSYGKGCARPEYYGVYTNVNYFRDWVESVTGKLPTV